MLTSVFGEIVDRISVSMYLVLITAYADVDFTKLMANAKVCFTRTLRTFLVFYESALIRGRLTRLIGVCPFQC